MLQIIRKEEMQGQNMWVYIDVGRVSRLNVIGWYIMLDSDCPIEGSDVLIFR